MPILTGVWHHAAITAVITGLTMHAAGFGAAGGDIVEAFDLVRPQCGLKTGVVAVSESDRADHGCTPKSFSTSTTTPGRAISGVRYRAVDVSERCPISRCNITMSIPPRRL